MIIAPNISALLNVSGISPERVLSRLKRIHYSPISHTSREHSPSGLMEKLIAEELSEEEKPNDSSPAVN
jgi:hypothetical protein